jgi:hypothetical protein
MARVASITPQAFLAGIEAQLGEESARLVAQAYKVTPDMDQNLFMTAAMRWIGDVIFEGKNLVRPDSFSTTDQPSTNP